MQCTGNCASSDPRTHKTFEQPVLQTLQMFVGEAGCWLIVLVSHIITRLRRGRTTAYKPLATLEEADSTLEEADEDVDATLDSPASAGFAVRAGGCDVTNVVSKPIAAPALDGMEDGEKVRIPLTGWKVLLLALPAGCDIVGTTLINIGLLFVAASIYQMTRGALVLFVGLFSVVFLKRHLGFWKWMSLVIVVIGVALVGVAGYLESKGSALLDVDGVTDTRLLLTMLIRTADKAYTLATEHTPLETLMGVALIAGAQIFTASQFVLEESIMERYAMDPVMVVGWEGTFGFSITLLAMAILHPAVGQTEAGRGGYFDARAGLGQMFGNRAIAISSLFIMVSIG